MQQHPDPDQPRPPVQEPRRRSRSRRSPSLTMTMATREAITGRGTRNGSWVELGKKKPSMCGGFSGHGLRRQTVGGHA